MCPFLPKGPQLVDVIYLSSTTNTTPLSAVSISVFLFSLSSFKALVSSLVMFSLGRTCLRNVNF